jgi:predicted O-methyltransferase YrrM
MPAQQSVSKSSPALLKADERNAVVGITVLFMVLYGLGWWTEGPVATVPALAVALGLLAALVLAAMRRLRTALAEQLQQSQSLLFLHKHLSNDQPLPAFDSAALFPDAAATLVGLIRTRKPRLVVELGSGTSTLIAALCLRDLGCGRLISLKHDPRYSESTRDQLRLHGLEAFVDVVDAPLVPQTVNGRSHSWYDPGALNGIDVPVDMLIVDGPPRKVQPLSRYPALPLLIARLSADALVFVDDTNRSDEREMVRRWQTEFPGFRVTRSAVGEGSTVFERRPANDVGTAPGQPDDCRGN